MPYLLCECIKNTGKLKLKMINRLQLRYDNTQVTHRSITKCQETLLSGYLLAAIECHSRSPVGLIGMGLMEGPEKIYLVSRAAPGALQSTIW